MRRVHCRFPSDPVVHCQEERRKCRHPLPPAWKRRQRRERPCSVKSPHGLVHQQHLVAHPLEGRRLKSTCKLLCCLTWTKEAAAPSRQSRSRQMGSPLWQGDTPGPPSLPLENRSVMRSAAGKPGALNGTLGVRELWGRHRRLPAGTYPSLSATRCSIVA